MEFRRSRSILLMALAVPLFAFGMSGCAVAPPASGLADLSDADPLEPLSRGVFAVNVAIDHTVLRPAAFTYNAAVPSTIQTMLRNFMHNLRSPIILANDLLQAEFERAGNTFLRAVMNTSFGIVGLADIASEFGIPRHKEDFGQTLAVWGVGSGPYIVLPFFGSSTPRDAAGKVVDILFDPLSYASLGLTGLARTAFGIVDFRAANYDRIDALERTSLDYYAAVRGFYLQSRAKEIRNGRPLPETAFPDM